MKRNILFIIIVFSFSIIVSCKGSDKKETETKQEMKSEVYQCPMKCNDTTYEKPGNCPVCGMELEKVSKI